MTSYNPLSANGAEYPLMVLLVDDQPMVAEAIRRLLAQEGDIDLHYCSKPLNAISDANQINPTVILQDLVMPNLDGLDLVAQFRANKQTENTPIIVLSTKEDPLVKGRAFSVGANDYIVKLPDKIELIARIRYHSRAYLNQVQRDEAYQALRESQKQLLASNTTLIALNHEMEEAHRTISELARYDPLTGLANRRVLDEELERQKQRCSRQPCELSAVMIDIDHFKSINDEFGHAVGDQVLRAFGKMVTSYMRPYDLVSRFGGEEFVILLVDTGLEDALKIAERVHQSFSELSVPGVSRPVTASFGVASLMPGQSPQQMLENADLAMYSAKQNGRNRIEIFLSR